MLDALQKNTILAALRNGLGLSHACRGLHKDVKEVSDFIRATPSFELECQKNAIAGYQSVLVEMNNSMNKKSWEKWRTNRNYLDSFITTVNLWESFCNKSEFSFERVTLALKHCKTIQETATAMGFTETEFYITVYNDPKLVQWLIQNNIPI